jgi:polyisoprenoid-binding protein YceI
MMSTILEQTTAVPAGTWKADATHSNVGFAVKHMAVGSFKGGFDEFDAKLENGALAGTAKVASVNVKDEQLNGHLQSPDFFDTERYPTITITSGPLEVDNGRVTATAELSLRGVTRSVQLTGTIAGPATDPYGNERLGLDLEAEIDRTAFGVNWTAALPNGQPVAGNEVKLTAELEFVKEA